MASPKLVAKSPSKFSPRRLTKKKKEWIENTPPEEDSSLISQLSKEKRQYMAVAAIDFGTTYSGYAYAFTRDPGTIHAMNRARGSGHHSQQPTVLLLTENGQFHSFGCEAQEFYRDIDESEALKWLYFEKFKMELHTREV